MKEEEVLKFYREAFAALADIYPQEIEKVYPEEFWEYFHGKYPNISREKMKELLKKTGEEKPCSAKR